MKMVLRISPKLVALLLASWINTSYIMPLCTVPYGAVLCCATNTCRSSKLLLHNSLSNLCWPAHAWPASQPAARNVQATRDVDTGRTTYPVPSNVNSSKHTATTSRCMHQTATDQLELSYP